MYHSTVLAGLEAFLSMRQPLQVFLFFMSGSFWLFIIVLFCYICYFYYLYVVSLIYAFGWSAFLCRIRFCDTPRCNLFLSKLHHHHHHQSLVVPPVKYNANSPYGLTADIMIGVYYICTLYWYYFHFLLSLFGWFAFCVCRIVFCTPCFVALFK
jgi:hypothetical protein